MELREKLFQLGLGTVLPPIVLAIVLGILLVQWEQDAVRRGALDRNRAFMTAVDAELRGHITSLDALGASRRLEAGDFAGFHEQALRVLPSQPGWQNVVVSLPSGQQVVNTARPPGEALPQHLEAQSLHPVMETRAPTVGNVTFQDATGKYGVPVRVPIFLNGSIAYVLSAVVDPQAFSRMIEAQNLPPSWRSGLFDRSGHLIARVPERAPGQKASDDYLAAIAQSNEGWYRGRTIEGIDTYTAHYASSLSGWTVGLAIPTAEVNAAANRAAWLVSVGTLITLVLAAGLAFWLGRRVTAPIAALAAAAASIGRGKPGATPAVETDIEELREVARALSEASTAMAERQALIEREQSILRAADRAKDEFLAMLGHELRNPLSAVSNAAALLSMPDLPAEHRTAAHAIITRQTEQLTRLVNDLLDVGRVVAGKIHLEQHRLDLREVTTAAISAIRATGRAEAHRINVQGVESVMVEGDRTRLEQVVTNLVLNAVTYTPVDGEIVISVGRMGDCATLSVTDTGVGLREEDRQAVFDLFYQADKTLHRKGGLGIGLTLVKRLVEMHGGTVAASSSGLGKGSTFTVRIPLATALMPAAMDTASGAREAVPALRILVVDDSEDARNSLQLRLEAAGHAVHVAGDGLAGLDAAVGSKPDVAIIDIGMPGIDGYELARDIREQLRRDILLIALTGYGQAEDVRRAMAAGFDAHMVKPADFAALDALMTRYAHRWVGQGSVMSRASVRR